MHTNNYILLLVAALAPVGSGLMPLVAPSRRAVVQQRADTVAILRMSVDRVLEAPRPARVILDTERYRSGVGSVAARAVAGALRLEVGRLGRVMRCVPFPAVPDGPGRLCNLPPNTRVILVAGAPRISGAGASVGLVVVDPGRREQHQVKWEVSLARDADGWRVTRAETTGAS